MQYKDVVVMLRRLHASMFYAPFLPALHVLALSLSLACSGSDRGGMPAAAAHAIKDSSAWMDRRKRNGALFVKCTL